MRAALEGEEAFAKVPVQGRHASASEHERGDDLGRATSSQESEYAPEQTRTALRGGPHIGRVHLMRVASRRGELVFGVAAGLGNSGRFLSLTFPLLSHPTPPLPDELAPIRPSLRRTYIPEFSRTGLVVDWSAHCPPPPHNRTE